MPVPSLADPKPKGEGDDKIDPIVMQGRNLTIDAAIVRIMKARREPIEHKVRHPLWPLPDIATLWFWMRTALIGCRSDIVFFTPL